MIGWIFTAAALLVVGAWVAYRRRLSEATDLRLSDDAIRRIEAGGWVEVDEPVDFEEAAEEEERFWSETWDEPEPL